MAQNGNEQNNFFATHLGDQFASQFSKSTGNIPGASNTFVTSSFTTSSGQGHPGTRHNFTKGSSSININDGTKLQADGNIVVGAANVQKTKKPKLRSTSKSPNRNYQGSPGGNFQNFQGGNFQNIQGGNIQDFLGGAFQNFQFPGANFQNTQGGNSQNTQGGNVQNTQEGNFEDTQEGNSEDEPSDIKIKIGDNVTFNAGKNVIIGAKYVTINDDDLGDDEIKEKFYKLMGGKEKFEKGFNMYCESETDYESKENPIRKEPLEVLKICSSICMIIWGDLRGTGFLAKIPGFEGVVMLTAGHNFKKEDPEDPFEHEFYFKAMDGNEKRRDVVSFTWEDIASTSFLMVTANKGHQFMLKGTGDPEELQYQEHPPANKDLDYCAIFLPAFEKFFDEKNLQWLEVRNMDVAQAEKVFYVGHPHIGFSPGKYKYGSKSATLKLLKDESYKWTNESGESWRLYRTGDQDRLRVDEKCPHYKNGYIFAQFNTVKVVESDGEHRFKKGLLGPNGEQYLFEKADKDEKDSKALRFSYGTKKQFKEDQKRPDIIKYTLDTNGGASGSPVLGGEYTVKAIHTFGDPKTKLSGGTKISSVIKILNELKTKFPEYFSNEPVEDFVQNRSCQAKLENGGSCYNMNPIEVEEGQNALEGIRKAKEMGSCVRVHLSSKDLAKIKLEE